MSLPLPRRPSPLPVRLVPALLALVAAACSEGRAAEASRVPTVVLVTLDTLRPDHLGCYGYPRRTSPFLDRMATEGVLFEDAIAVSSHTAPAHASLFTSLYPIQHRVLENGYRLRDTFRPLARILREAGWDTAAFTSVGFLQGLDPGFDVFVPGDYSDDAGDVVGRVEEFLRVRAAEPGGERPLFLWIHLYDPHQPYLSMESAWFQGQLQEPAETRDALVDHVLDAHAVSMDMFPNGRDQVYWLMTMYDSEIRYMDAQLERLYAFMDGAALNRDALWVFVSDHGEGLGDHELHGHDKYLYQEQLEIALIVHEAGADRVVPSRSKGLTRQVDVLPTVLEWAGATPADAAELGWEGHSLMPVLTGAAGQVPVSYAFSQRRPAVNAPGWRNESLHAIQTERYKLILHGRSEDEFYDLQEDPHETTNLVRAESRKSIALRRRLQSTLDELEAAGLPEPLLDGSGHLEELSALGYLGEDETLED